MSSNVGLSTPRGSGTSGYVQRNLSLLKPRAAGAGAPYTLETTRGPRPRKPDQAILTHDRLREVEVRVLELRDKLEDAEELDDDAIDAECEKLRVSLIGEMEEEKNRGGNSGRAKALKGYQVHELAEAKAKESERLRRALGLRKGEGGPSGGDVDGDADDMEHPMARQERRRREKDAQRVKEEIDRERDDDFDGERSRERDRRRNRSP